MTGILDKPHVFERDGLVYFVTPVAPVEVGTGDELAFADDLLKIAPNEHIGWLRGQYVEADRPNQNGQFWASTELEIASLTPVLMPVTVMHDPRTAVGMIADAKLVPLAPPDVPRARIDTTLGIWRHRFPETWEEIAANYRSHSLMQSMECRPAFYDCLECGQRFPNLPGHAEAANWCAHLKGGEMHAGFTRAPRKLGNVTFTGTGLIYGTRGKVGALDTAHLDVFQDEVAEFHERAKSDRSPAKPRRKNRMDIEDKRYEELVAAEQELKTLKPRVSDLEETASKVPALESKVDALEIEKKTAEDELASEKTAKAALEETARATTMADERKAGLGDGFLAKLPDTVKTRLLDEQAKKLSDDDWRGRLEELAELVGVAADAKGEGEGGSGTGSGPGGSFTPEELAAAGGQGGSGGQGGGGQPQVPSEQVRRSVIGGLGKTLAGKR